MANNNQNLNKAKQAQQDEFYTRYQDIAKEVKHYGPQLQGKVIYCNADDTRFSQFYQYFKDHFLQIGITKLICTNYVQLDLGNQDKIAYHREIIYEDGELKFYEKTLQGDGDFRSDECLGLLWQADVVITNPPFSLFREYVEQLMTYKKQFLIIGNMNALSYINIFNHIKINTIGTGKNGVKHFIKPNGETISFGNIVGYTNIPGTQHKQFLPLTKLYEPQHYQFFDNSNIINIDKVADIPADYNGLMAVPVTFLIGYCYQQFKVLEIATQNTQVNGQEKFKRIIIKKK